MPVFWKNNKTNIIFLLFFVVVLFLPKTAFGYGCWCDAFNVKGGDLAIEEADFSEELVSGKISQCTNEEVKQFFVEKLKAGEYYTWYEDRISSKDLIFKNCAGSDTSFTPCFCNRVTIDNEFISREAVDFLTECDDESANNLLAVKPQDTSETQAFKYLNCTLYNDDAGGGSPDAKGICMCKDGCYEFGQNSPGSGLKMNSTECTKLDGCSWDNSQTTCMGGVVDASEFKMPLDLGDLNPLKLTGAGGIATLIGRVIKMGMGIMGSIALIMIVYGGFLWMTAMGNAEKEKKSREIIVWSGLGVLVILGSYVLTDFVLKIFQ